MSNTRRRRSAGREAKRAARQQMPTSTAAYIDRKIPYFEILSEAALELIENHAPVAVRGAGRWAHDYPVAALFADLEEPGVHSLTTRG